MSTANGVVPLTSPVIHTMEEEVIVNGDGEEFIKEDGGGCQLRTTFGGGLMMMMAGKRAKQSFTLKAKTI